MSYRVVEKFVSVNGEGKRSGQLAIFIRFAGCNLRCTYCDTMWANKEDVAYTAMSKEEIYEYIKGTGVNNVTLTGGEPLIQAGMDELLDYLCSDSELTVEIETNGSVDIGNFSEINVNKPKFTMDYKLASSGMEDSMLLENFTKLSNEDTVKFVVGSVEELNKAKYLIDKYRLLDRCSVYFSPIFGSIEPETIVEYMKDNVLNNVVLQLQLHKIIWSPDKKGV